MRLGEGAHETTRILDATERRDRGRQMHAIFVVIVAIVILVLVIAFIDFRIVILVTIAIVSAAIVIATALELPRGAQISFEHSCTSRIRS